VRTCAEERDASVPTPAPVPATSSLASRLSSASAPPPIRHAAVLSASVSSRFASRSVSSQRALPLPCCLVPRPCCPVISPIPSFFWPSLRPDLRPAPRPRSRTSASSVQHLASISPLLASSDQCTASSDRDQRPSDQRPSTSALSRSTSSRLAHSKAGGIHRRGAAAAWGRAVDAAVPALSRPAVLSFSSPAHPMGPTGLSKRSHY
jgi:hypothetical protein